MYWIGGGSGAGKSTIARRLARQHGLRLYSTDDVMADHGGRIGRRIPRSCTRSSPWTWMSDGCDRSPGVMLETFDGSGARSSARSSRICWGWPDRPGVVAEGFRLLPGLVRPLLAQPGHAVWLLPTPRFRHAALRSRGTLWQIAGKTTEPDRALANMLERDRMFTERLRAEAVDLGLPALEIDITLTEDDLEDRSRRCSGSAAAVPRRL